MRFARSVVRYGVPVAVDRGDTLSVGDGMVQVGVHSDAGERLLPAPRRRVLTISLPATAPDRRKHRASREALYASPR